MLAIFWILLLDLSPTKPHPRIDHCVLQTPQHLICTKHPPSPDDDFPPDLHVLELHDIEEQNLDLRSILVKYPKVENVSIYDGSISNITLPTPQNKIKVLQLVRVGFDSIGQNFLPNFPELETLNLQGNYLESLEDFPVYELKNLYLGGNRWNCSSDLGWVLNLNQSIVKDVRNFTCFGNPHPNKNLFVIANFTQDLKHQCPTYCSCSLPKVVYKKMGSDHLEPIVEVNCSNRGLTELPLDLPPRSKIIRLEGNDIEDLKPLKQNPVYKKAFDLYLDNNKIKSIDELEGSYFLRHFRVFSLSGNKLTEVPTYALDNALEQNTHMPNALRLSLGGNPWRCDCVFTPVFQEMLQKFAPQIQDLREVKCSYVEGDENSLLPIIELSRSSVCRSPTEYSVQALDLLNGVLASLILLILGKLAYDYWYFKKTGRLPWIVTKMP